MVLVYPAAGRHRLGGGGWGHRTPGDAEQGELAGGDSGGGDQELPRAGRPDDARAARRAGARAGGFLLPRQSLRGGWLGARRRRLRISGSDVFVGRLSRPEERGDGRGRDRRGAETERHIGGAVVEVGG